MIAITFALRAESVGLKCLLKNGRRVIANQTTFFQGELHGRQIALCHTGVGANVSQRRTKDFLTAARAGCLISAGFAGALSDDLRVGDLFIADNFSAGEMQAQSRQVLAGFQPRFGKLVTTPVMIDDVNARRELRASSGAVAVDMETEFIARACAEHGVPLLSLRAITDTPADPFPAPADILFNLERQKTELGRLALYLLSRPPRIIPLVQFARRVANARSILTRAIDVLVESAVLANVPTSG